MTNPTPDAALLWAREQIAGLVERNNEAAAVMRGESREDEVDVLAEAFRAGQSHADAGLLAELHQIKRTAEMSAGIMRDTRRTGGWAGAERTADAFQRIALRIDRAIAAAKGADQ